MSILLTNDTYTDRGSILLMRTENTFRAGYGIFATSIPGYEQHQHLLHPTERLYYDQLKAQKRKKSYLLGRLSAKYAIQALQPQIPADNIHIDFGVFGFPVIRYPHGGMPQVCITHCENTGIALAFDEAHPMGIDLEKTDESKTATLKTYISAEEERLIADCNLSLAAGCTCLWTIKEALSKVIRTGLTLETSLMEIKSLQQRGTIYESSFKNFGQYKVITLSSGDYFFSMVIPYKTTPHLEDFKHALTAYLDGRQIV